MKRICKFLIVILFFSIATGCVGTNEVEISDQNLESAIRKAIGKPDAPIYVKDLKGLTELEATYGVADLTGLEYCTHLEVLWLGGNKITDIAPLSKLVKLKELDLRGNRITDIAPLSKLVNLELLNLGENGITYIAALSNIAPLSKLVNLKELYLWGNGITDIAPLSKLVNLNKLNLERNKITDIEPLVHNAGLSKGDEVDLAGNPLSKESRNVYIPELRQRGVFVRFY